MKVRLENQNGEIKEVKAGFSWTTFFFSFFVPLFRKDWKWFGIMLATKLVVTILALGAGFSALSFAANIAFALMYNSYFIKKLLSDGWQPMTEVDEKILKDKLN